MPVDAALQELIRRVRAGDEDAAAELVRQYEPELRRYIRLRLDAKLQRVLDSVDICQSILGNFFLRVAGGQFDLDDSTQLRKLLVTMALNRIRDHARKPANRRVAQLESHTSETPCRDPSPSQIASGNELLQKACQLLTAEERYLAEQRRLGREWADIASECGKNPEALRKQLSRAMDRVARQLGLDEVNPE